MGFLLMFETASSSNGVMSGIRFNNNTTSGSYSSAYKGAILFQDNGSWGVGDMHFALNNQTASPNNYNPATLTDAKMTIKSSGNVGIGTTSPSEKLNVDGNVKVDNGFLNVGGTSSSITKTGVYEFDSDDLNQNGVIGWQVNDQTETSATFGFIEIPNGASSVTIYKVEYDVHAYHEDNSEGHWLQLQINGVDYSSTRVNGLNSVAGSGFIITNFNRVIETVSITTSTNNAAVKIKAYDEGCCLSDYFEIQSVRVKLHYTYTVAAQDGDIIAGGRVYANSTKSVGDVAEYFPVNDGVEIGHIISTEPGKSNYYKLANEPYSNHLVGVISNEPSVVLNDPNEGPPVGLTGRVIVKLIESVNLIKSGDFITSSNQKGLGQLADKEGPVIGYAVRDQKEGEDFVEILLQPGRYFKPKQNKADKNLQELEKRIQELEEIILQKTMNSEP